MCKKIKNDKALKEFRVDWAKSVSLKMGQIAASTESVSVSTDSLCKLLKKVPKEPDPAKRAYMEFIMADRIVAEAAGPIRNGSNSRVAWPVAHVVALVFANSPSVQKLYCGLMHQASPYLSGCIVESQSCYPGQKPDEDFDRFTSRMLGYHRLWFAVLTIQGDFSPVWQWLARTLNVPASSISAPLLHAILEMTACETHERYRRQFEKLVTYMGQVYIPDLQSHIQSLSGLEGNVVRSSHVRLKVWVDEFKQSRKAALPEGRHIETVRQAELNRDM